jgi:transketolase
MTQIALKASQDLKKNNINSGVLHLATVKPLDKEMLSYWIPKVKKIITVEEGLLAGGFGSSILEFCSDNFPNDVHKISRIGLKDSFIDKYGTQELLFNDNNLTKEYLITEMLK